MARAMCCIKGHAETRFERRWRHGLMVMHLCCPRCGAAWPAVNRTADEHEAAVTSGAPKPAHVTRTGKVISLNSRKADVGQGR